MSTNKFVKSVFRGLKYACDNMADEAFEEANLSDADIKRLARITNDEIDALVESNKDNLGRLFRDVLKDARTGAKLIVKYEID